MNANDTPRGAYYHGAHADQRVEELALQLEQDAGSSDSRIGFSRSKIDGMVRTTRAALEVMP